MSKRNTRIRDLELAVGALSTLVERLIVGGKQWKGDERMHMLATVEHARLLANCEHMPSFGVIEYVMQEQGRESAVEDELHRRIDENAGAVARAAGVKEKVEPARYGTGERFFLDLPSGDSYATDDVAEVRDMYERGQALNVYDRSTGAQLIWRGSMYAVGAAALGYPPVGGASV